MISVWFWHRYAVRPLHLLGGVGGLCILAGLVVAVIGIVFYFTEIQLFRFFLPTLSSHRNSAFPFFPSHIKLTSFNLRYSSFSIWFGRGYSIKKLLCYLTRYTL